MSGPLDGIRVADFTQAHQGPWATQKLGDLGADVIKIERIGGTWSRDLAAGSDDRIDGASPFWLSANRNKRSVTVDLKSEAGSEVAHDVVADVDVLVENFRPGVMDRLGFGYEAVTQYNPEIVYVSASGFGSDGPYADRPGQDLIMQGLAGIAASTGRRDDPPTPIPFPVVDGHSAMQIVTTTLAALFYHERTGEGQHVEVNLLDAAIDTQCQGLTVELNLEREFERSTEGIGQKYLAAPYGIYETVDDYAVVSMATLSDLGEALSEPWLAEYDSPDAAFEHRDEIKRRLDAATREWTTDDLVETLVDAGIWAGRVKDFEEAADDPQIQHNEMIIDVEHPEGGTFRTTGIPATFSETPGEVRRGPPAAGEHTDEVLRNVGYDDDAIEELRNAGAVE